MVAFSYKARFVGKILIGLYGEIKPIPGLPIMAGNENCFRPKRQTIRAQGKRRPPREGETLQHYYAMRTRQCTKIGDGICTKVTPIHIKVIGNSIFVELEGRNLLGTQLIKFSQDDGFESPYDMRTFWLLNHGKGISDIEFSGNLIEWAPKAPIA